MSRFFNFLIDRCPSCGLSATTICPRCWFVLNDVGSGTEQRPPGLYAVDAEPFHQRVLFRWDDRVPRPASVLRDVILSSKEHPSPAMIRLWATELTVRARVDGALSGKRDWLVIPPPGRSGRGEADHAGALAQELARVNQGLLISDIDVLERVGESRRSKAQKLKTRQERAGLQFRLTESAKNRVRHAAGFLFIDDVIVTGATARAAWAALGKPRAFECWAVAHKTREHSVPSEDQSDVLRLP